MKGVKSFKKNEMYIYICMYMYINEIYIYIYICIYIYVYMYIYNIYIEREKGHEIFMDTGKNRGQLKN